MLSNKNKLFQSLSVLSIMAILLTGLAIPTFAANQNYYGNNASVPSGTIFNVEADEEISSKDAEVGDTFTGTIKQDVYVGNNLVIPNGSQVIGRVTDVTRAANKGKAGAISVKFVRLRLPNGVTHSINGSLTNNESNFNDERQVKGDSTAKRNIVFIGGSAGIGAIIGAMAGGTKGAAIGALVGGGLGTVGAIFIKGQEAKVKRGDSFGVVLNQSVNVPDSY